MPKLGVERSAVQEPLLRYAAEAGWTRLPREEAERLRRGTGGLFLHEVLVAQLQKLNPGVVDLQRSEEIVRRLGLVLPTIEGNLQAWEWLRGLKTVFVETERRERNVRLLDADHPAANPFHVTDELRFTNGTHTIRADVVCFVNGVPVIVVETKAATRLDGVAEALAQIRRYQHEAPELLAVLQLHTLTHLVQFYYGATWNLSRKALYNWRDEQSGDFETLVKRFIAPARVLRVLSDFILFTRKDGELAKVVLRPHQMRAVERVLQRAKDPAKKRGLIWHTQGSGKTYTMITVARLLVEDPAFQNPTVLLLVDRNELEAQLFANITEAGFGDTPVARSKRDLRGLLGSDRRGLIVSMIHKFDDVPADLNPRSNIFVLVDEAHRTTGGDLGTYLLGALPNATYIGFTGTPIDRTAHGRGTFKVFGQDDERGYLDKYSIRESVEDGTTVPLNYALAANELLVDQATLEREFLALAALEGVSDVEELNRVLDRAVNLKNLLKNPGRVAQVAAAVAAHFRSHVAPMGYKAFLVAVDREACGLYKEALDKHLPPDASRVVISHAQNDPPELTRYQLSDDDEQAVRKAFTKPEQPPQILIVTEKLLTGYDAPILYCLYLDKPMRDHVLLQAIARVNRPYEDREGRRKPAGFILDFVGIFDKLEQALAFDSADVESVVEGLDVLQSRFLQLMQEGRADYLGIAAGKVADKAVEAVLDYFRDGEVRQAFYRFFRELEELYEILSPDVFLRPFVEDYERLADMYRVVRGAFDPGLSVDKSLYRKTAELVQQHTHTPVVREPGEVYALDERTLRQIAAEPAPDTVKVFNLLKQITDLAERMRTEAPHLIPIGDRANAIAEQFKERQISTEEALAELLALVQQYEEDEQARQESDLPAGPFAIWRELERQEQPRAREIAVVVAAMLEHYPYWRQSQHQEQDARRELYKGLLDCGVEPGRLVSVADSIFELLRKQPA
jgi:type I restriction enzyme R subunit